MKTQARQEKELDEIKSDYCTSVGSNFYGMRELLVVGLTRLVPAFSNTSATFTERKKKCCRSPQTPAVAKTTTNTSWDFFGMHNKNLTRMKYVKAFFFISGHSQIEADGIHSRVEQASSNIEIFTTSKWAAYIRGAKRKAPYFEVPVLDQGHFLNIKSISEKLSNVIMI